MEVFSTLLIGLRIMWIYPGTYAAHFIRRRFLRQRDPMPSARAILVVGWTGMRGVIALAAAMSLPETLPSGAPFPERDLIILLTFSVILVTLVLQGLSLPPLVRALGLAGHPASDREERDARRLILETALQHIEARRSDEDNHHLASAYSDARTRYQRRLAALGGENYSQRGFDPEDHAHAIDVGLQLIRLERATAIRLRNEGRISDELLRNLGREFDLNETSLQSMTSP